jgi:hypothetical protein
MSRNNETDTHLPDPPRKLADRIKEQPDDLTDSEVIIGNGDIELTSKHPVSRLGEKPPPSRSDRMGASRVGMNRPARDAYL